MRAANTYLQHNLVADQAGLAGQFDPNLVNPWGLAFSAKGPFWIAEQGTGRVGIYNSAGATVDTGLVSLPSQTTGIVQNSTADFPVASGAPALFIFCSAAGTISASFGTSATAKIDNSMSGSVYTGLAVATSAAGSSLYVANFHTGTVEVYDANFNPVTTSGSFQDPNIPSGFAPYNIWAAGNKLYVSFAKQDATRANAVAGAGNGYVDLFDVNGSLVQNVASGGTLNAPWGMAIAPTQFGDFAGALLVANSGDGTIDAFNISNGRMLGVLANGSGQMLSIQGLRAIAVGNGSSAGDTNALYFTAGTAGQTHGLFGSLQGAPVIGNNGVVNGASFQLGAAPYTFVSILGSNLSSTTRSWQAADFVNGSLPRSLDGVSASINGTPAYVAYISPTQLNVLMPLSTSPGPLLVVNQGLTGAPVNLQFSPLAPAFFQLGSSGLAAATHADGTLIGPPGMFSSISTPAQVGEVVTIYGNGFGATSPAQPDGSLLPGSLPLLNSPTIMVGGIAAQVLFAGLTAPGLYQFNVVIPQVDPGPVSLTAQVGPVLTPVSMITVR